MHRLVLIAAIGTALLAAPAAHAQQASADVYQWKDASGVTHYSESPPRKGTYQTRRITHASGVSPVASATATAAQAAENPQCVVARRNVAALDSDRPVGHDADGDGKPDANMSGDQRAAQRALAQAAIKAYCTP